MASRSHLDDDDDFGGDFPGANPNRLSGTKRSFGDIDDDEDDIFGSKKANIKVEETAPGVTTGMILSLRESLQSCQDNLATCQSELEAAKSEVQKWHSAFQKESFIPADSTVEPRVVINYLQNLKSSEESLREQLEKTKRKEAAFIVTIAKREQEIADLKSAVRDLRSQLKPLSMQARRLLLDPAIHEEFMRLKNLVEEKDKKIKELQDNVAAVNFTPQSKMGKMLMAKCRTLQQENEEIGNQAKEGKIHELSMKLATQKSLNVELRNHFEGLCKHLEGLTNDVEKSNEMSTPPDLASILKMIRLELTCNPSYQATTSLPSYIDGHQPESVLILEEKLEDKEAEIQRLKQQLQQKSTTTKEITEIVTDDKTDTDEEIIVSIGSPEG